MGNGTAPLRTACIVLVRLLRKKPYRDETLLNRYQESRRTAAAARARNGRRRAGAGQKKPRPQGDRDQGGKASSLWHEGGCARSIFRGVTIRNVVKRPFLVPIRHANGACGGRAGRDGGEREATGAGGAGQQDHARPYGLTRVRSRTRARASARRRSVPTPSRSAAQSNWDGDWNLDQPRAGVTAGAPDRHAAPSIGRMAWRQCPPAVRAGEAAAFGRAAQCAPARWRPTAPMRRRGCRRPVR